jgi:sugar/nucleoside kinase (ribokinase family)
MHKVVVVGAAVVDVLLKSDDFLVMKSHQVQGGVAMCQVMGGKIEAQDGLLVSGGAGTNVAVGLHRLGQATKMIVRVGDDDLSDLLIKQVEKENVDLSFVQRGKGRCGLSAILVGLDGGRSIVTYRGESGLIDSNKIDWKEIEKADWIQISSLGGEMGLLEDIVGFANSKNIRVGVNPGKKELEQKERMVKLLPKIDFFNVNRMEASLFWDCDFEKEREMIKNFLGAGCKLLAITDGKRGAMMADKNNWIRVDAFPNKSVDDTGAGDAFVSGSVFGILEGKSIEDVIKMGLANGGSVVTKLGAKAGLLYKDEMEKWLNKKLKVVEEQL